ncbi:MAG: hypothetical protein V2A61_03740 [Calditrichota bacterium]
MIIIKAKGFKPKGFSIKFTIHQTIAAAAWWILTSLTPLTAIAKDKPTLGNITLRTPRIASELPSRHEPRRDAPVRILALRVEFAQDTLTTTSGDGSMAYAADSPLYKGFDEDEPIVLDPPPHDSLYFADHLTFLDFYWRKMSNEAVNLTWAVYPSGDSSAYRLPRQMWQYNWNYSDEQLDRGLAELFRDAVQTADADTAIHWSDWDLVVVFHAGAGSEFDLGYTTTPHDIPSAWMVQRDFETIGLPNGVPVEGGANYVKGGLLLPETESHEGVQISLTGALCSLFGHWLGLPALYDRDNGDVVVGKWSLMDRGFGNFYGAIPGPVDAWSRGYMGWLDFQEILSGNYHVAAPGFGGDRAVQAYKIPITTSEYFLLECRSRDPEEDTIAVAWDRNGRRMVFNEDYSVEPEPGFRVPVRIDNLDFDSPGSGILIWHVDEALLDNVTEGRFNSVDNLRGLDLEEADGAQDIGNDYPFLTPGWLTDYGIFADAWFRDNLYHQQANEGRAVSFNDDSYPESRANSGARTNIVMDSFGLIDTVMSFRYNHSRVQFQIPVAHARSGYIVATGNYDADPQDEEFCIIGRDTVILYNGDGSRLQTLAVPESSRGSLLSDSPVVRDLNGDQREEVIWFTHTETAQGDVVLNVLTSLAWGGYAFIAEDTLNRRLAHTRALSALGGEGFGSVMWAVFDINDGALLAVYDASLRRMGEFHLNSWVESLHRLGSASSDSFLVLSYDGRLHLAHGLELEALGQLEDGFSDTPQDHFPVVVDLDGSGQQDFLYFPVVVDIDGSEQQDFLYFSESPNRPLVIVHDPVINHLSDVTVMTPSFLALPMIPWDVDGDGQYELTGYNADGWGAVEANGLLADNFPLQFKSSPLEESYYSYFRLTMYPLIADFNGDGELDCMLARDLKIAINTETDRRSTLTKAEVLALDISRDKILTGFPMTLPNTDGVSIRLAQLDDDPPLELLFIGETTVEAVELWAGAQPPQIWWDQPYRDKDHSNAVWEPARAFSPPPGGRLILPGECYNWPNPAWESTAIRFQVNWPAQIKVDIFDLAGERVTTLYGTGVPGLPNEIIWNLQGIPHGGYMAIVKAEGRGRSESKKVKIAVW